MRKLLFLTVLFGAVSCQKHNDVILSQQPQTKKIELHIHASETYTQPLLDSVRASVTISIYKRTCGNASLQPLWDTAFISRPLKAFPLLPEKHKIEKEFAVYTNEKLQVLYNIRYHYNGTSEEAGNAAAAEEAFTFIDVKL